MAEIVAKRVLVLGGTGMLGSMVADVLARDSRLAVTATTRSPETALGLNGVSWAQFRCADDLGVVADHDWIVNCVGVIKPFIRDDNADEVENAVRVNALLPHELAVAAAAAGAGVLQIATDCVYSGAKGAYAEDDLHDALDVYGKTKSLGEVSAENVFHLRASIVGPEAGRSRSLLEWFLGQERGARINGFVNHRWNGVTTLHFAKVCGGIVAGGFVPPARHHLVPKGAISKHELLQSFASSYGRDDVIVNPVDAPTVVDRTLATTQAEANVRLWRAAGHDEPPTVPEMVAELARYDYRLGALPARLAAS
jgi:dTDP-4-dehydrorhamnose reductase